MKLHFILLFGLLSSVVSFDFVDPEQDGVNFGSSSPTLQTITVDEDNAGGRVKFVKVTDGTITANTLINPEILAVQVEPGDLETEVYVTSNLLDYELLRNRGEPFTFIIDILQDGDPNSAKSVNLVINNLDDENPVLLGNICTFKEETVIDITNSDCVYQVSDPDGFLSTIDFSAITGSRDESSIFEFKYKETPPDDALESDVYLVLKDGQKLDYETMTLYNFREDATDSAGHPTLPLESVPVIVEVEDIPDQRPQWISFHSSITITDDTKPTEIQIAAVDGDYEINNPIIYGVIDNSGYVHIDGNTGLITVDPIPKDSGLDQLQFYAIALEDGDPNSNVVAQITLLLIYE